MIVLDMEAAIEHKEQNSETKSSILSLLLFLLLLLALVIPIFHYQIPPPEQAGVLVSFGEPDKGSGNDAPAVQQDDPNQKTTETATTESEEKKEVKEQEKVTPKAKKPAANSLTSKVEADVIVPKTTKKSADITPPAETVDPEAERLLEEQRAKEAAAKLEAEKKEQFEKSKKQFGDFLSGTGKGQNTNSGNQGDPGGDPNSDILTGISKGTGRVGGGLSNRGVLYEPDVKDNSQKTGKIVMKVCVNTSGIVTEASFTQRGSTTVDGELRDKAKRAAQTYKFTASEIEEQCGTITFDFKVE